MRMRSCGGGGGDGGADGTPRQLNDGKWPFRMQEDGKGNVVVDIEFPRFMDTSLLDVDVQPTYFRVTVRRPEKRDKVIQVGHPARPRARFRAGARCERASGGGGEGVSLPLPREPGWLTEPIRRDRAHPPGNGRRSVPA